MTTYTKNHLEYYINHKEQIKKHNRTYYLKNKKEISKRNKIYRINNKETKWCMCNLFTT